MMSFRSAAILIVLSSFGLAACSPAAPETIDEPPVPTALVVEATATEPVAVVELAPIGEAALYIASEPVSVLDEGGVEPMELYGGETVSPTVGSEIVVGEGGVGLLGWPGFLRGELMSHATVVIDQFDLDERHVVLSQQPGTARYTLKPEVGEATVGVIAGPVAMDLTSVPGDVIVSHQPAEDGDPVVWVVVINGEANLTAGAETDDGPQTVTVGTEEVVAFVPGEGFTEVMSIEPVSVEIWYGALTAGRVKPITLATFRCEVVAETADVMDEPELSDAEPKAVLNMGNVVDGLGRNEDGTWVQVAGYGITGTAWVLAETLKCIFPVGQMGVSDILLAEADPESTPTVAATKAVAVAGTGTPTMAPTDDTGSGGDQGSSGGDGSSGGNGNSGSGGTDPTDVPPTEKPAGPPTETECVGTDCVAPAPPTETPRPPRRTKVPPTDPPMPTDPPPPATEPPPPTDPPPPPPTEPPPPPPTDPPAPTDPPPPEPTEAT